MANKLPNKTNVGVNMSTILGAQGSTGSFSIGGADTISIGGSMPQAYVNFSLIKAHGGTIVQCRAEDNHVWEYYVIPENTKNFDRELGKIISMHLLKG